MRFCNCRIPSDCITRHGVPGIVMLLHVAGYCHVTTSVLNVSCCCCCCLITVTLPPFLVPFLRCTCILKKKNFFCWHCYIFFDKLGGTWWTATELSNPEPPGLWWFLHEMNLLTTFMPGDAELSMSHWYTIAVLSPDSLTCACPGTMTPCKRRRRGGGVGCLHKLLNYYYYYYCMFKIPSCPGTISRIIGVCVKRIQDRRVHGQIVKGDHEFIREQRGPDKWDCACVPWGALTAQTHCSHS